MSEIDTTAALHQARTFIADLPDLTPDQYSKAQCERLHKALLHVSFLLAKADGVPQSRRPDNPEPTPDHLQTNNVPENDRLQACLKSNLGSFC